MNKEHASHTAASIAWLTGIFVLGCMALLPFRLPFLEILLFADSTVGELVHLLGYAWLAAGFPLIFRSVLMLCVTPIVLVLSGLVLEFIQMHIPNRRFSEQDLLADSLGIAVGFTLGLLLRVRVRSSRR